MVGSLRHALIVNTEHDREWMLTMIAEHLHNPISVDISNDNAKEKGRMMEPHAFNGLLGSYNELQA